MSEKKYGRVLENKAKAMFGGDEKKALTHLDRLLLEISGDPEAKLDDKTKRQIYALLTYGTSPRIANTSSRLNLPFGERKQFLNAGAESNRRGNTK